MKPLLPSAESYNKPPATDEIEVTIIGPGFGETAVAHIGDGRWLIIDSCTGDGDPTPASLRYLHDIGVSPSSVCLLVVSHWDDDHCSGMGELVRACDKAEIAMSKIFIEKDFAAFAAAYAVPLTSKVRSGVREIRKTMCVLQESGRTKILGAYPDRRLIMIPSDESDHAQPIEIWSLSPSDLEADNFVTWAQSQMPMAGETRRVARKPIRNDLSTVIYLSVGSDVVLFGGDLEEEGHPQTGWSAILSSTGRPQAKAALFKVPHHGSETGDHPDVWLNMLDDDAVAVLAPFRRGRVSLPGENDARRIYGYTNNAYASAHLKSQAPIPLDRSVEKTINETAKRFITIRPSMGLVRARKKIGSKGEWGVEIFGSAVELKYIR